MGIRSRSVSERRWPICAALVLAVGGAGCGKSVSLVPVTGEVKLDGKPVADCAVMFVPIAGGPAASGVTDAQGRYELSTVNRPGAVPGEHRVTIAKQNVSMVYDERGIPTGASTVSLVPAKYGMPESSGLKGVVGLQENTFVFDLSSQ